MKKIIYLMLSAIAIGFTSCNDNFMELYPDTSLTEKNGVQQLQYLQDLFLGIIQCI